MMKQTYFSRATLGLLLLTLAILSCACGPTVTPLKQQATVTVDPSFQARLTPLPTVPPYRCGAWASDTSPGTYSTITIFARMTKDISGVSGATATAVVHFQNSGDVQLDQQPVSDSSGYVSFTLPLSGRQPAKTPATVDVSFSVPNVKQAVQCSSAFFTPR